jgi:hypothetical protein
MSRDLTTAMQTAIQQPVIRPVLIAYLDIDSDPITMWTGAGTFMPTTSGDAILNGKTYYPSESFIDVTDIVEDQGIGGPVTITLKANDIDEDALRQVCRDRAAWRGRDAYLWLGLLDTDLKSVYADPVRIKTGIMTSMTVNRSYNEVFIQLVVDVDIQNARTAPFRLLDHQRVHAGDTFSSFMVELSNKPSGLERSTGINMMYNPEEYNEEWYRNTP